MAIQLRPVRPPIAVQKEYHKKLKAFIREMDRSLFWWLRAAYRPVDKEILTTQDGAMGDLVQELRRLEREWLKKSNTFANETAKWFSAKIQGYTAITIQAEMKRRDLVKLGFDLQFKYHSFKERAMFKSIVTQNVNLIKSIASEHLTRVTGVVLRGIESGHDLGRMTEALKESFGVTERRAAMISRDQTNKATQNLSRQRLMDYGVTKGKWQHSSAGNTYRESHVEMDGEIYDLDEGCYDPDYGDFIQPAELVNCHCFCCPVIDMENKEQEEPTPEEEPQTEPTPAKEEPKQEEPQENYSELGNVILSNLEKSGVEFKEVVTLENPLSMTDIIERVGGGDLTGGSCASCAWTYAGNRAGFDVLDFRGGKSRDFFKMRSNTINIANLPNVKSQIIEHGNDFVGAKKLLATMEEGKEYYLATGKHASIVRKVKDGYEFLELQDQQYKGWHKLDEWMLDRRFGCQKSHTSYGMRFKVRNVIIDIETLKNAPEFRKILGYVNTAKTKQRKGAKGHAK